MIFKILFFVSTLLLSYTLEFRDSNLMFTTKIIQAPNGNKLSLIGRKGDSIKSNDYLIFANPIFNFKIADINHDGVQDFCIGLIKTTRWNKEPKPKLHIYSHKNGKLYPIWRSSNIGINFINFEIDTNFEKNGIRILDNPIKNKFNISLYSWQSFGLKYVRRLYSNLDSNTAILKLKEG